MQMEIAHAPHAAGPTPACAAARVRVQAADFDLSAEVADLRAGDAGVGAVAAFVGTVRDRDGSAAQADAPVSLLELEHYPGMTERAIEAMIDEAQRRFGIRAARVVHRIGPLALNEQIVLVAVSAAHRGEAFQACEFLMDYLKTQAPFWKKEHSAAGARWVDARVADDAAAARWGLPASNLPAGNQPASNQPVTDQPASNQPGVAPADATAPAAAQPA